MALVPGLKEVASGSGHWFLGIPVEDQIAIDDPNTEFQFPTVKLTIDLRPNNVSIITFTGPPAPNPPDSIGFNGLMEVDVINDTGTTLAGIDLNLSMIDPKPFNLVPGVVQFGNAVNANYAFFTDIQPGTFNGDQIALFSPDGRATNATGPAASQMEVLGNFAPGQTLVGDFTLHNTELATGNNNFTMQVSGLQTSTIPSFLITDMTTGINSKQVGAVYDGPVVGLQSEIILATDHNINCAPTAGNVFIHTGAGNDAIDVSGVNGNNILDGSTGTNFLVGGTGQDTFYVDDRGATSDIFSTVRNFHSGDDLTVWGITQSGMTITHGNDVLPTAPGLDFAITAAGKPNANVNLPGYSTADLINGRLMVSFGRTQDLPGLAGSDYMLVHAN